MATASRIWGGRWVGKRCVSLSRVSPGGAVISSCWSGCGSPLFSPRGRAGDEHGSAESWIMQNWCAIITSLQTSPAKSTKYLCHWLWDMWPGAVKTWVSHAGPAPWGWMLVACGRCQARSWAMGPGCTQPALWAMLNAPQIQVSEAVEEKESLRMPRGKKHKTNYPCSCLFWGLAFAVALGGTSKASTKEQMITSYLSSCLHRAWALRAGWRHGSLPQTHSTERWASSCFWQPWGCPSLHFLPSPYCSGRNNSHWWITKRKQHLVAAAEGYETTFLLQSILHRSINLIKEKSQLFKITAQQLFCLFSSNSSMKPPRCLPLQNSGCEMLLR